MFGNASVQLRRCQQESMASHILRRGADRQIYAYTSMSVENHVRHQRCSERRMQISRTRWFWATFWTPHLDKNGAFPQRPDHREPDM
eukprot:5926239-Pyramimonas_sp.AAC.1